MSRSRGGREDAARVDSRELRLRPGEEFVLERRPREALGVETQERMEVTLAKSRQDKSLPRLQCLV